MPCLAQWSFQTPSEYLELYRPGEIKGVLLGWTEGLFSACLVPSKSKQEDLCTERKQEKEGVSDVGPHPAHAGYLPDKHRLQ